MQEVAPGVRNLPLNLLDYFGFRLLPVVAELDLARHLPLVAREFHAVLLLCVDGRNGLAVRKRCKAGNANVLSRLRK